MGKQCWCGQTHDEECPPEHGVPCPYRTPGRLACGVGVEGCSRCTHYHTEWFGEDGHRHFHVPKRCWVYLGARVKVLETAGEELATRVRITGRIGCQAPAERGACTQCPLLICSTRDVLIAWDKAKGAE